MDKYKTKHRVKYCIECQRPWQAGIGYENRVGRTDYLPGMPTYGLERKTCLECEKRILSSRLSQK